VPTARVTRTIGASAPQLWEVISDPHHLPRWWPRVVRVENVQGAGFTQVMKTAKGKVVRADFTLVRCEQAQRTLRWAQALEGSPFARLLKRAETEVRLAPTPDGATEVTIELAQSVRGLIARLGSHMVRRAAAATLEEALEGLARISAPA
jgi:uncharacterized protein YndB with AHSA1/START domain